MGQTMSKDPRVNKARSDAINRQIAEGSKRYEKCKILLLGSGESGKSTIVKQIKIILQAGFTAREHAEYRTTIYKNVLDSAGTLARVVRRVGVGRLEEGEQAHAARLLAAFPAVARPVGREEGEEGDDFEVGIDPVPFTRPDEREHEQGGGIQAERGERAAGTADVLAQTHAVLTPVLTPALADAIFHVAKAQAVEQLLDEHPAEFYLMDNALYFFASIHRIAEPTYVPSEEDILRAYAKNTATIETQFWMGDSSIHMFDVGGQRSERKKWIHCFESVTSIIFCTALSEYDQVLEEERRVNRMRESLYLFESVINSRWFLRTSVILFLNKIDVFKRKLPKIPLGRYFPEYAGGNDLQKAAKYILWKFMQENRAKLTVYPHMTQATNTKYIRLVFAAVKETILQNALKDSDIL
ncbi:heterotrimeric G-protein alpha subunit, GPA3-like protein [Mycena vulgaris]|nr:heterotrimeric G-protein alpha subunit, GPA3-like protein [Mycena vulgaris]